MILFEIVQNEAHPAYQALTVANGNRQYDFLKSAVEAALQMQRPFISSTLIKALNYQAIVCLHTNAGEYRPCPVRVGDHYIPPDHYRVQALMDDFINTVNRSWTETDAVYLASYVLWRLNFIHPFINGNGRTARAVCYFVLCVSSGGWLLGTTILPELIRRERPAYVAALAHADESFSKGPNLDLGPLHALLSKLLAEQIQSVQLPPSAAPATPNA